MPRGRSCTRHRGAPGSARPAELLRQRRSTKRRTRRSVERADLKIALPAESAAGTAFGLSVDDFDFSLMLIRVRRQVKRLGKKFVFALPKNDKERFVPMAPVLAKAVKNHIGRFGTTTVSLPWERLDGDIQKHDLIFSWPDDRHLTARLHDELVWKPALAEAGVIPLPYKDSRGRRRFKTDRTTGLARRLTEQSRSRTDRSPDLDDVDRGPGLL